MRFLTEDTEVTEEGLDQGEGAVPIKAINAVSHRGHRGHRGRLGSGETPATIMAINAVSHQNTEVTEKGRKQMGDPTPSFRATTRNPAAKSG